MYLSTDLNNFRHLENGTNEGGVVVPPGAGASAGASTGGSDGDGWSSLEIGRGDLDIRESTRSHEVSKPRDLSLELTYRFRIWQASRQQCCRDACQISKWYDNLDIDNQSCGFETYIYIRVYTCIYVCMFESCLQQRKTTCLLSIRISLACARASKLTTTNIYIYYGDVTWTPCRLNSPVIRLFLIACADRHQRNIKVCITAFCDRWIPHTKGRWGARETWKKLPFDDIIINQL